MTSSANSGGCEPYLGLMKQCLTASIYDESGWTILSEAPRDQGPSPARPLAWLKAQFLHRLLAAARKRSLVLVRRRPFDPARRHKGEDWPLFGYTMVGHRRLENVQRCIEDVLSNHVPGDLIETGVWRGGTTIFMRAVLKAHGVTDRTVWVADSFEGMPVPDSPADGYDLSDFDYLSVSLDQVRSNFERFGLLDDQVRFLKGWFSQTLPDAPIERLAILRLDCDLYSSTMDALTNLYDRVSPGGYVIVDDYHSWPSQRRAVTDFLAEHDLTPDIKRIDRAGAYWKVEAAAS